eukprot:m.70081 g.70081  ORF g.70081 m.70081 type:complete len:459 (+) comp14151_c0_seq4:74-1450(+)
MRSDSCSRCHFEQIFIAFSLSVTLLAIFVFVTSDPRLYATNKQFQFQDAKADLPSLEHANQALKQQLAESKRQAAQQLGDLHARLQSLEGNANQQKGGSPVDAIQAPPKVLRHEHDPEAMQREPHDTLHLKPQVLYRNDTCEVNPSVYFEDTGVFPLECVSKTNGIRASHWTAVVLSLPDARDRFLQRQQLLRNWGMDATRFEAVDGKVKFGGDYEQVSGSNGEMVLSYLNKEGARVRQGEPNYLTPGERGYRATMERLFSTAVARKRTEPLLIMDDDFVLSCQFDAKLQTLLARPRCGGLISSSIAKGGVLLLGSTIFIEGDFPRRGPYAGGWRLVEADMQRLKTQFGREPACYNINQKVFGSFAGVYHPDTFEAVLQWLKTTERPYDHMFAWLSRQGYPVRAASDPVVIQDVSHPSDVDPSRKDQQDVRKRAKLHRWNLDNFCMGHTPYLEHLYGK